MSVIPYTTQMAIRAQSSSSQESPDEKVIFVHQDNMTERQSTLMQEAQEAMKINAQIKIVSKIPSDIPRGAKTFVIPHTTSKLQDEIRSNFEKARIYLPRAVIESIKYQQVKLSSRNLAISLTMRRCRIFVVKAVNEAEIRKQIFEMSGKVVCRFEEANVVVTDRADDKYSLKAFKQKIPVVSREWVNECYKVAVSEDSSKFNLDAMDEIISYKIKPLFGLKFLVKTKDQHSKSRLQNLITQNGGILLFGNDDSITHTIYDDFSECINNPTGVHGSKNIDKNFLYKCIEAQHFLPIPKVCPSKFEMPNVNVKKEKIDHLDFKPDDLNTSKVKETIENRAPSRRKSSTRGCHDIGEMMPPTLVNQRQQNKLNNQPDPMNEVIMKALSFEMQQTQAASTQMRRLPDSELLIEKSYEPSQQLFWN